MLFRFGDVLSLLFGWSTIQSAMRVSDPDHLLFDYTRLMMGFRLFLGKVRFPPVPFWRTTPRNTPLA